MCFPMIPAGASNDDIIVGPGPAPSPEHPTVATSEEGSDFAMGGLAGEEAVGA
jgi:hypothetical protein